jgi:hypothetical protein
VEGDKPKDKPKLNGFPVANIPVVCPMDGCSQVVWAGAAHVGCARLSRLGK